MQLKMLNGDAKTKRTQGKCADCLQLHFISLGSVCMCVYVTNEWVLNYE